MKPTDPQHAVIDHAHGETVSPSELRRRAQAILDSLHAAKAACFQRLEREHRADAMEHVTGSSSFDRAIDSAERTIEALDRAAASGGRPALIVQNATPGARPYVPSR